jgi:hypothetical protein
MADPIEPDLIIVQAKVGNAYVDLCGIETASINRTANTSDRFRRSCDNPAAIPTRTVRVNGKQWDASGSGVINMAQFGLYESLLGMHADYRFLYERFDATLTDGERTSTTYGYRDGRAVMTSDNENIGGDEGTAELSWAGEGTLSWTTGAPGTPVT